MTPESILKKRKQVERVAAKKAEDRTQQKKVITK
jgi:hypothetical protein